MNKKIIWLVVIILLLPLLICLFKKFTPTEQHTFVNYSTIIGLYISICAFVITVWQVWGIKDRTESIQSAVVATQNKIQYIFSVADIAKTISTIRAIKDDIDNERFDVARVRLCDVKDLLESLDYMENITLDRKELNRVRTNTLINLSSIDKQIRNTQELDRVTFNKDMEEVATLLNGVNSQLKNKLKK